MVALRLLPLLIPVLLQAAPAGAHERWSNGDAVPAWVKRKCCGPDDVHNPSAAEVHFTAQGYRIDGYKHLVPAWLKLPSPDGGWWIFYHDYGDGHQTGPGCFFGPDPAV